jgi:predicted O-linked N-acetylglucosamine transferase (SPINDLY family)
MSSPGSSNESLFQAAIDELRNVNIAGAESQLHQVIAEHPGHAEALHLLGVIAHRDSRYDEAIGWIKQAIEIDPKNQTYYCNLGECYRKSARPEEAITFYRLALKVRPDYAMAHYNLGIALSAQGDYEPAIESYRQALKCRPGYVNAITNLANLLKQTGKFDDAMQLHKQVVALDPNNASAHFNLANTYNAVGLDSEAEQGYRQALALRPNWTAALNNLGILYLHQGRLADAGVCHEQATRAGPRDAASFLNLAAVLREFGKTKEAIDALRHALSLVPRDADVLCRLADLLDRDGKTDEAQAAWNQALALASESTQVHDALGAKASQQDEVDKARAHFQYRCRNEPRNLLAALRATTVCPTVFASVDEIDMYRNELDANLDRLAEKEWTLDLDLIPSSGAEPPFNLPFHGRNDLPLKRKYAHLLQKWLPVQDTIGPRSGKPHVGLIVTPGHEGVFLKSVVANINRFRNNTLRLTIVCPAGTMAAVRKQVTRADVEYMPLSPRFSRIVQDLRNANFDLIYFHEIGSDAINYFLSFFRMAPIQCTTWGIQVTSGSPQMDYYLSSRWTEPDQAADHYSEELVLLDTMLKQPMPRIALSGKKREEFGMSEHDHVYFCPQHLGKFHPSFDEVLGEILRSDTQGKLLLIQWPSPHVADRLMRRFRQTITDVVDRIVILPHQNQANYQQLIVLSDVLLDPHHFCGVNTTYDALALNKAVVTMPGEFQRGRFTLGCYRKMGMLDCVAEGPGDYESKALQLATDAEYRCEVESKIAEANPLRVDPDDIAQDLEATLMGLIEASRSPVSVEKRPLLPNFGVGQKF